LPIPDIYRGKFRDIDYNNDEEKLCQLYVNEVRQVVEEAESRGRRIAIFLIESFQSCGGQIIYPKGYLKQTFQ
jgi:ethanolamine-phosphate phospho-lyase